MNNTKIKINKLLSPLIFTLLLLFSVIFATGKYSYAVLDGINLWVAVIIPSLFPFLFITALLSNNSLTLKLSNKLSPISQKLFNINGSVGYAFVLSLLSGYPMGAKAVCDLRENQMLSKEEAQRSAILCSTSSPSFTIGSVGGIMFNNVAFGISLYLCNVISTLITAFIFSNIKREKTQPKNVVYQNVNQPLSFYDVTYSSIISLLVVGGMITLFYIIAEVLFSLNILLPFSKIFEAIFGNSIFGNAISTGIIECTRGIKTLSNCPISFYSLPISAFICGFGGVSVIAQSLVFLKKAKIKTAPFILSKIINAVISFCLGIVFSFFIL